MMGEELRSAPSRPEIGNFGFRYEEQTWVRRGLYDVRFVPWGPPHQKAGSTDFVLKIFIFMVMMV